MEASPEGMSDFLEFRCPSCDRTNLVDRSEIGESGSWRNCQACNARIYVSGEGAPSGGSYAPESEAPGLEEGGLGVHLRMPSGKVERLSAEAIEHGVGSGRILPWDLVSDDGQEFVPISDHPELGSLFVPADFTTRIATRCANHPDAAPARTCSRCGRSYCASCVASLLRVEPKLCPACSGPVREPDPRLKERPPWERVQELALLPVEGDAWKITLGMGALIWIASFSYTWPLALLALTVLVEIALAAARGEKRVSLPRDAKKSLRDTAPIAVLSVVLTLPLAAFPLLFSPATSVLLQAPWSLLILLYGPVAAGLLLLGVAPAKAVHPRSVLRAMGALKEHYLLLLLGFIAVGIAVVAVRVIVSFLPWVDGPLGAFALAYGAVLQAYLLGWTLYMHRERLLAI